MKIDHGNMAALSYGVGAAAEIAAGWAGSRVAQARAGYQRQAAGINRDFAKMQAADVRVRGDKAAQRATAQGRRVQASQRAGYAAQGVDVGSGSAADVQADTALQAELDANEIRTSAFMQAWGIEANAENEFASAQAGADALEFDANSTLAVGGLRALSQLGMVPSALDWKRGGAEKSVRPKPRFDNLEMKLPSKMSYRYPGQGAY